MHSEVVKVPRQEPRQFRLGGYQWCFKRALSLRARLSKYVNETPSGKITGPQPELMFWMML